MKTTTVAQVARHVDHMLRAHRLAYGAKLQLKKVKAKSTRSIVLTTRKDERFILTVSRANQKEINLNIEDNADN
jgi:ribosomal protein L7Ae-like RNA K-turn-binding protein